MTRFRLNIEYVSAQSAALSVHVINRFTQRTPRSTSSSYRARMTCTGCILALDFFLARKPCSTLSNIKFRFRKPETPVFLNDHAGDSRLGIQAPRGSSPTKTLNTTFKSVRSLRVRGLHGCQCVEQHMQFANLIALLLQLPSLAPKPNDHCATPTAGPCPLLQHPLPHSYRKSTYWLASAEPMTSSPSLLSCGVARIRDALSLPSHLNTFSHCPNDQHSASRRPVHDGYRAAHALVRTETRYKCMSTFSNGAVSASA